MTQTSPPLWKQLLGAGAGALVALAMYGVYEGVVPRLDAYLVPKETLHKETLANVRHVPPQTQARFDRIAKKTRAMVEEFDNQHDVRALEEQLVEIAAQKKEEPGNVREPVVSPEPMPSVPEVAAVVPLMPEASPLLPESGVAMTLGVLAASIGGVLSLRRRKKE